MKLNIIKIALSIFLISAICSCQVGRFFLFNVPDVNDYKLFPFRTISTDSLKFNFESREKGDAGPQIKVMLNNDQQVSFDEFLQEKNTLAFLVIRHDTIVYEKYFDDYDQSSLVPSFSVAKAVTSTLIGCAIDDGYIQSVEQPITDFIPEMKDRGFEHVKIKHLLQMTSGINFREDCFHLWNSSAEFYYGINIRRKTCSLKLKALPGQKFEYASGNTQLLGLILGRALKTQTVTEYLEEKIWQPLGMEYEATWSLDREKYGFEKTFCCLNARARDFAKIGRLYLHKGEWNGQRIISPEWIKTSTMVDTTEGSVWNYQYQWWLASKEGDFYARGMLGQYIYVNPEKNLIIVRLGKRGAGIDWPKIFTSMAREFDTNNPSEEFYIVESKVD